MYKFDKLWSSIRHRKIEETEITVYFPEEILITIQDLITKKYKLEDIEYIAKSSRRIDRPLTKTLDKQSPIVKLRFRKYV